MSCRHGDLCDLDHWARELQRLGHDVRLMLPAYIKPYVKRNKNDAANAAAICEAVIRPSMRFVAIKFEEQQGALMLHRTLELLMRQRTMLVNAIRGHIVEFGIVAGRGSVNAKTLLAVIADPEDGCLPPEARTCLRLLAVQVTSIDKEIAEASQYVQRHFRSNPVSRRLETILGIDPVIATATAASVPGPAIFRSGRELTTLTAVDRRRQLTSERAPWINSWRM